ncbi:hypothetical protein M440DRAFT_1075521 [Trichoderma longibrachiatum ATCC 18648]|uniref:Uncharacterized protein n=1 Tax=Trichoderma longibrachiatum ATCC 18648 TaxID=983965 RepID=A0A2T4BV76_TRILO|nr:hypothetical protein M440DRAFT_1075521 [Trichoderma longibrachiatum ATCC 18648]
MSRSSFDANGTVALLSMDGDPKTPPCGLASGEEDPRDGRGIDCSTPIAILPKQRHCETTHTITTTGTRSAVLVPMSGTRTPLKAGAMWEVVCATSRRHSHTCHSDVTRARHGRNRNVGCSFWLQDAQGG